MLTFRNNKYKDRSSLNLPKLLLELLNSFENRNEHPSKINYTMLKLNFYKYSYTKAKLYHYL